MSEELSKKLEGLIEAKIKELLYDNPEESYEEIPVVKPLGKYCDHTVLRAYTTEEKVKEFCKEALDYGAASVCVMPYYAKLVRSELAGSDVKTCVVVGFPLGTNTSETKAFEAAQAVCQGAQEVDMVINVGALRDKKYEYVYNDIKAVVDAAKAKDPEALVKVIIETCYLNDEEKVAACVCSSEAGADYVKTSTGFGTDGAYADDVRLMYRAVDGKLKVKASTNVNTQKTALEMIHAGADRLGISRVKQIVTGEDNASSASRTNQPPKYR